MRLRGKRDYMARADAVFMANAFREMDSGKARRELDWQPRPIAETIRDAVAWYARQEGENHA